MTERRDRSGAESLVKVLVEAGVDVCFANPGTSEMHVVAALDTNPEMHCVLGLFEGVLSGAADGMGVPGWRATTAEEFNKALGASLSEPRPSLIEAMI